MIVQSCGETLRVAAPTAPPLLVWSQNALSSLPELVAQWRKAGDEVAGLISYEAGMLWQGLAPPATGAPLAALYRLPAGTSRQVRKLNTDHVAIEPPFRLTEPFTCPQPDNSFLAAIARIKAYLAAGDCYQVNLARRWQAQYQGDPLAAFMALYAAHPAPWASYFPLEDGAVFGVSPERFLTVRGRRMTTQPIKGSRPRSDDSAKDDSARTELETSTKDRAENLMIVDLLRNDLGAIAEAGSVCTPDLFSLQSFSNVHHLVSTVTAKLRDGLSEISALMSCMPGGSITGAPKRRAMEIISELEPQPRGFYCGTQFWLGDWGLDSNILIRTFQAQSGTLFCHGGGGIVIDSDPEGELEETAFKVVSFMNTLNR